MTPERKQGLWHHVVAGGRDILVVSAVISLLSAITVTLTKPFWEPFSKVPEVLAQQQQDIQTLSIQLAKRLAPQIVEFEGKAQIVGPKSVFPGEKITFLYFLKRNASCKTNVDIRFYDVERGFNISAGTIEATQAPVTKDFIPFRVDVTIPRNIGPGFYIYNPKIEPLECGVYEVMTVIPSEIFEVRSAE